MKLFQQDDIHDASISKSRPVFRFIHLPTGKIVRAVRKKQAIHKLKEAYNLTCKKEDVRQTKGFE